MQLRRIARLTNKMLYVSDTGDLTRKSSGYSMSVLNGIIRDCAHKIRAAAEVQRQRLVMMGEVDE